MHKARISRSRRIAASAVLAVSSLALAGCAEGEEEQETQPGVEGVAPGEVRGGVGEGGEMGGEEE